MSRKKGPTTKQIRGEGVRPFILNLAEIVAGLPPFTGPALRRSKPTFRVRRVIAKTARYEAKLILTENRKKDPQRIIEKMTNHERNLWARAGYPKGKKFKEFSFLARARPMVAEAADSV